MIIFWRQRGAWWMGFIGIASNRLWSHSTVLCKHETIHIQRQWPVFLIPSAHYFLGLESGFWMCKQLDSHSAEGLHQQSTDRVTGSFASKNLRTGADDIEVFRLVNASSSTCSQDHSTSFWSSWHNGALSWDMFGMNLDKYTWHIFGC